MLRDGCDISTETANSAICCWLLCSLGMFHMFSVDLSAAACSILIAGIECKNGLLYITWLLRGGVTTHKGHAADHVIRFPRPSPSICILQVIKTGGLEGLGMRRNQALCSYGRLLVTCPVTSAKLQIANYFLIC